MLGLPLDSAELKLNSKLFDALPEATLRNFLKRGAPMRALKFLANQPNDARIYVIQHHDWIRVRGNAFYVWRYSKQTRSQIQRARTYWAKQIKIARTDEIDVTELSTGDTNTVSVLTLAPKTCLFIGKHAPDF